DRVCLFFESTVTRAVPRDPVQHSVETTHRWDQNLHPERERLAGQVDCLAGAFIPALGVANGQDDLGAGIMTHQLFVERAAGPVDRCLIALEQGVPVDRFALASVVPYAGVLEMREDVSHVVALDEAELFERRLERQGTRS